MANLVIDIGNSFIKVGVFTDHKLVFDTRFPVSGDFNIDEIRKQHHPQKAIISSVAQQANSTIYKNIIACLHNLELTEFSHHTAVTVKNKYKTPESLGLDRLAAVIGAKTLFNNTSVLVIDAGTCITYDHINVEGEYFGGSISPGINMRLKALNKYTARLPLVDFEKTFTHHYGVDTQSSILSGVINGAINEIKGFIADYQSGNPQLKVIICGGDGVFFDTRLKNSIFAHQILHEPNLVLIGLNTVVNYQND